MAATAFAAGALAALPAAPASAATTADAASSTTSAATSSTFVSYDAFIKATAAAQYGSTASVEGPMMKAGTSAFTQMRQYILAHYRGVQVKHSYLLDGSYFDCVVTATQPSVRDLGISHLAGAPTAPTAPTAPKTAKQAGQHTATQVTAGGKDTFGNLMACPTGTIPLRRMTLDETVKFSSLAAYLGKQPAGMSQPTVSPAANAHRYGVGYQSVANTGSNSWLNLWNVSGDFSLSQLWDVSEASTTQTLEAGWIHYPGKFGTSNSVLFIFWTPNNYASGCYDLDCSGFVQTSSAATLGGGFNNYSTSGGTQWGFGLQYEYYQGNWWLFYSGTALGYYPGSIYNGGPLNSGSANLIEYGGEAYTGGTNWPQMGSGAFASAGFGYAAFQNTIFYLSSSGVSQ